MNSDEGIQTFGGPSIHCDSAAAVIRIDKLRDVRTAIKRSEPLLHAIKSYTVRSKGEFLGQDFGSTIDDASIKLLLGAWVGLCNIAECEVFECEGLLASGEPRLMVSCVDNQVAELGAKFLINLVMRGGEFIGDPEKLVSEFKKGVEWLVPKPAARSMIKAARHFRIPYQKLMSPHIMVYGAGRNSVIFKGQASNDDGHLGTVISRDKNHSKILFSKLGLPVAESVLLRPTDSVEKIPNHLFPCVLKPLDGFRGAGVYVNLSSPKDLARASLKASKITKLPLIVERQIPGDDVRLLVCRGELLVAVKRARPSVVGDGIHTIARLVELENLRRSEHRSDIDNTYDILMNEEAVDYLLTLGMSLDHVPREGEKVYVRGTPHGQTGGVFVNITDEVHPEIVGMAILASERLGGALCGLDYISNDHTQSPFESGGVFLEINTFPGLGPVGLLSEADQFECRRKILGRAAVLLDTTVYVGQSRSELQELKDSVIDEQTAWYCDGQLGYGLAVDERERPGVSVSVGYERCMLDSRAHRLVFLLTSTEVERAGLPCGRIKKSVVIDPANVSEQVRELLKRCSDGYEESSSN